MNKILKFIFEQWQEDRLDGKAERLAYNYICNTDTRTIDEAQQNDELMSKAINEVAERAFLAGFNTAVGLKDLIDGKTEN